MTIVCRTSGCSENGIEKSSGYIVLPEGEKVICGECGAGMEVLDSTNPPLPWQSGEA